MIALAAAAGAGCARPKAAAQGIPAFESKGTALHGTLAKQNEALLDAKGGVTELHAVGDSLFVYTGSNQIYALSRGLDIRYLAQVAAPTETIRPPVQVGEDTVFPVSTALELYRSTGERVRTVPLPHPLTSDVRVDPNGKIIGGTAAPTGGRIAVIDPQKTFRPVDQSVLIGTVLSAPVSSGGVVYVANEAGEVFAIGPDSRSLWQLPRQRFVTDRTITADLVADDYAVYVPSTDTKLYALNRNTGAIKWRFLAQVPLNEAPLVTADRVFQVVPERGLVALHKTEGPGYREPLWTAQRITKVLGTDARFVYAVEGENRLVALALADGTVKLSVDGNFQFFAAGPDQTLYAATRNGAVVSFKHGPYVGEEATAAR
jgi:outer membrane protein assembly factor BamB